MTRTAVVLMVLALNVAVLGTLQFALVVIFSGEPTINPAVNGVLMWLSWGIAGLLLAIGAGVAFIGRTTGRPTKGGSS